MADATECPRCGGDHAVIRCPYVKAVEFEHPGDLGSVRRLEFLTPADLPAPPPAAPDGAETPPYPTKGQRDA